MAGKARRIDFYPDEYIAGVGGRLSPFDQGVYWMVCSLIYSSGGPIDDDHVWLSRLFADTHWRTVRASINRLIEASKLFQEGGKIGCRRCADELQRARKRMSSAEENGGKGGRPSKQNKRLAKPPGKPLGSGDEKLTNNYQLTTNNIEVSKEETPMTREDEFDIWYRLYPHKVGKGAARRAFVSARKKAELETLIVGVREYIAAKPADRSWCNPATWLNQERWLDEAGPAPEAGDGEGKAKSTDQIIDEVCPPEIYAGLE